MASKEPNVIFVYFYNNTSTMQIEIKQFLGCLIFAALRAMLELIARYCCRFAV